MNKTIDERKIKRNIFLLPIISILLLSIITATASLIYINSIQKEKVSELKSNLIKNAKVISKERVNELEDDIRMDIKELDNNTKNFLKLRVHEAATIIKNILNENPNKSKEEIKKIIKQVLGSIRYNNGRGYYYIYEHPSDIIVYHPIKKIIGQNFKNAKDKRGTLINANDAKIIDNPDREGFKYLYFSKPSQPNKEFKKINYIKYIEELGWMIGTGEYIEDAKKELQEKILKRINSKRYGTNGYFWIHDTSYKLLEHPFRKNDIGINDENLTDASGKKIIKLFVDKAIKNSDGAFVEYLWNQPEKQIQEKKLSFVKLFDEWKWVIGTGVYLNDIESLVKKSKQKIQKDTNRLYIFIISSIIIALIIVSLISFGLSKQSGKVFSIYKDDLEEKIKKAVDENIKKDKLMQQQSKLASMGEMIGNIAHQWRQPLNALNINIQNLDDDFEDGLIDEEFLEKFIEKNKKIIEFMSHTIDDFRDFFRIDKKKTIFSAKEAILAVLGIQSAVFKNHNITVNLDIEDFNINGYQSEFKQALLNITSNAKDALIDNKIENAKIDIKMRKNYINIEDNAGGIPNEILERIFEPYFTTKEQGKGTGMGLYMTKVIIENNINGSLNVINTKSGAKFTIELEEKS